MWLSTPEVSTQEVKASWDAVGRIEKLLDDQVSHLSAACSIPVCILSSPLVECCIACVPIQQMLRLEPHCFSALYHSLFSRSHHCGMQFQGIQVMMLSDGATAQQPLPGITGQQSDNRWTCPFPLVLYAVSFCLVYQ